MAKVHLIRRGGRHLKETHFPEYECGYWVFSETQVNQLLSGTLYLHEKKDGAVLFRRRHMRPSAGDPGRAFARPCRFENHRQGRLQERRLGGRHPSDGVDGRDSRLSAPISLLVSLPAPANVAREFVASLLSC